MSKTYECYACSFISAAMGVAEANRPVTVLEGETPIGWQIEERVHLGKLERIAYDEQRGVWRGMFVRCPKHRTSSPTLVTLGDVIRRKR